MAKEQNNVEHMLDSSLDLPEIWWIFLLPCWARSQSLILNIWVMLSLEKVVKDPNPELVQYVNF